MIKVALIAACVSSLCGPSVVQRQVVRRHHVAHVPAVKQQVVAVPTTISYFVGAGLRQRQATTHDALEERLDRIEKLLSGRPQQQRQNGGGQEAVAMYCGKCHDKAEPDGAFLISGSLAPRDVTKSIRMLASGEMPQGTTLTKEQRNAVLQGLLSMEGETQ